MITFLVVMINATGSEGLGKQNATSVSSAFGTCYNSTHSLIKRNILFEI